MAKSIIMKVLCVNSNYCPPGAQIGANHIIKDGEIYNVIREDIYEGYRFYELSEHVNWFYLAYSFIPLSDIDEKMADKELMDIIMNG